MEIKTNIKQFTSDYLHKRRIDRNTLQEIIFSISSSLVIKPGDRILDIGCGVGRILIPLAFKHPRSNFVGLDISSEMLEGLKEQVKLSHLKNIEAVKADANYRLPFKNSYFDSIFLYHSYHMIKNKNNLVSEINRLLKSGGHLLIASTSHTQLATTLNYKYFPKMLKMEYERTPDLPEIVSAFKNNNIVITRMKEILIKKNFKSVAEWIIFLKRIPISALAFFDDKELDRFLSEMGNEFIKNYGDIAIEYGFDYHTQMFFQKE